MPQMRGSSSRSCWSSRRQPEVNVLLGPGQRPAGRLEGAIAHFSGDRAQAGRGRGPRALGDIYMTPGPARRGRGRAARGAGGPTRRSQRATPRHGARSAGRARRGARPAAQRAAGEARLRRRPLPDGKDPAAAGRCGGRGRASRGGGAAGPGGREHPLPARAGLPAAGARPISRSGSSRPSAS